MKYLIFFLPLLLFSCSDNHHPEQVNDIDIPTFQKLPSSQTKVTFNNAIKPNIETKANLFDFDYFYNGAGVGVADLNNDDLPDLFFAGNQVENKLYLNKGNFIFEDISLSANINQNKHWSNGVTFADVNADGWMDIYVSQGGPNEAAKRKNLLYINQGVSSASGWQPTFVEMAEEYGLADEGITTQSAFFDFDKDGDLDCVVMNENEWYGYAPIPFFQKTETDPKIKHQSSSHLYRNDAIPPSGGTKGGFIDVTESAGLLNPMFGLGLVVSDLNNDGWPDLYMASDYYIPDAMYINNKNGTFSNQIKSRTKQLSFYGMGADIADINNDGQDDIFVLDMAAADHYRAKTLMASMNVSNFDLLVKTFEFPYQYMFNSLQLNNGSGMFSNVAHQTGMAKTDWSWTVLMSDFNNDENRDIFITNGYRKYALDNDSQNKVREAQSKYNGNVPIEVKRTLYNDLPSEKLPNLFYRNEGRLSFDEASAKSGLGDPSFSNGAAVADLDGDGDLDLIVNNMDQEAFIYKNQTREKTESNYLQIETKAATSESFAKVVIKYNDKVQQAEAKRVRGYMSASQNIIHFGLSDVAQIDTLIVQWPSGKQVIQTNVQVNQRLTFDESQAKNSDDNYAYFAKFVTLSEAGGKKSPMLEATSVGDLKLFYKHKENKFNDFKEEVLLPYKQSTLGPVISKGDLNGDGQEDVFVGGAAGQVSQLFVRKGEQFERVKIAALEADKTFEDMGAVMFDYDGDGDNDLYVVSGGNEFPTGSEWYEDRLYRNDGNLNFVKHNKVFTEVKKVSGKKAVALDFDKDGDMDLLIANRIIPQNYPKAAGSILFENDEGSFKDVTAEIAEDLPSFGIVNDVIVTDFNEDGWPDFMAVGEWTGIGVFENQKGSFINVASQSDLHEMKGWWYSLGETDVNGDGKKDYLIGNLGLNSKYKASDEKPLKVFANDFDDSGSLDIVLSNKYKGKDVPFRGKECSTEQMPFIKDKFPTYDEFAKASLNEIYGKDKLQSAVQLEANTFESIVLINKGGGQFEKQALPIEVQGIPILDMVFYDLNKDGLDDAIVAGNIYNTEVETPRLDHQYGLVLLADSKNNFEVLPPAQTGFYLSGNVKSLQLIKSEKGDYLLAGKNDGVLSLFKIKEQPSALN